MHRTLLPIPLVLVPCLLAALPQDDAPPAPTPETQEAGATSTAKEPPPPAAMKAFARMNGGEWRVTYPNGQKLFQRWDWGPGKHSMRVTSYRPEQPVEPPNGVHLVFWHPGRKEHVLLGLLSNGRFMEGTMRVQGDEASLAFTFGNGMDVVEMSEAWTFEGADAFHETMFSKTETGVVPIRESDYVRHAELTPTRPRTAEEAATPSARLKMLAGLIGGTWEAKGNWNENPKTPMHVQSEFAWIPGTDAIHARAFEPTEDGRRHLLDAYFFHDPIRDQVRYLALSTAGAVSEGALAVLEDGGVEVTLTNHVGSASATYVERLDVLEGGQLRDRVWTLKDGERARILDITHQRVTR